MRALGLFSLTFWHTKLEQLQQQPGSVNFHRFLFGRTWPPPTPPKQACWTGSRVEWFRFIKRQSEREGRREEVGWGYEERALWQGRQFPLCLCTPSLPPSLLTQPTSSGPFCVCFADVEFEVASGIFRQASITERFQPQFPRNPLTFCCSIIVNSDG
jgi:hypothetical protein